MKPSLHILTIFIILIPLLCQGQYFNRAEKPSFFFVGTELDPRNAIYGSPVNEPAFDGVLNMGYRNHGFQVQASYENFNAIKFSSYGFQMGHVFNHEGNFNYALLGGLSMIERHVSWLQKVLFGSASISGQMEYHCFSRFYFSLRAEGRYRGDLEKFKPSGYAGIGLKI
ncbi:hypothetical protein GCM10007103_12780 [Salinimicrobium marinum]|uniref:Conjugative transposon protein TraO n=1 Tax=Salinimicrobium marinum TaxID=680283 RepID=A0A918VXV6_9FLAO|nr:hypothetical protein [Salinimicrobium marinum]GHA32779.1 hypothetical protein GCM10007103_12780 [Salinimicrobium marinum]